MRVSIITVCHNSGDTIEDAIKSVVSQNHPDIEYIIVDGGSDDNTVKIIEKYKPHITKVISEKDKGIYDALNKGIQNATGEIIGLLHADDIYAGERVVSNVVEKFLTHPISALYADLVYVKRHDLKKIFRYWKSGEYKHGMFSKGWMPPHPTLFVKKEVFDIYGLYNTNLTSSADYEFMLRLLHKHRVPVGYLPEIIVKMRIGGKSNSSFKNRFVANSEDRLAWKINNLKPGLFTFILKPISKIRQFVKT